MGARRKKKKQKIEDLLITLELWKHQATGELFICVDDDQYTMTLITPTGEIKKFGYDDFDGPNFPDGLALKALLSRGLIKQKQMQKLKTYVDLNKQKYIEGLSNRCQMWFWEIGRCRIIRKGS